MANKSTRLLWTTLSFLMWWLAMSAPVRAVEVQWSVSQFGFGALDGGGFANGVFVFDAPTLEVVSWSISVDAGTPNIAPFTFQSGLVGHTADVSSTGTIQIFYHRGLADEREIFFYHAAIGIPDAAGSFVLPGGGSGEYVATAAKTRVFPQTKTLTGLLQSTSTPADVAGGCRLDPALQSGDPVNLLTGAFTYNEVVFEGVGPVLPFSFKLFYDSSSQAIGGSVGRKWTHSYEWRLEGVGTPRLKVVRGDGAADYFDARVVAGVIDYYATFPQTRSRIDKNADGTFTYTDAEQSRHTFDTQGRLITIAGRSSLASQRATLTYGSNGRVATVTGPTPASAVAVFAYDASKRITSIDYGGGQTVIYLAYDASGNLAGFTDAPGIGGRQTQFTYDANANLLEGRTGTSVADNVRFVSNTYVSGKVVSQRDAYDAITTFQYSPLQTKVTDPYGRMSTRNFDAAGRIVGAVNPDGATFGWSYDPAGYLRSVFGPRGARSMTYDAFGQLTGMKMENNNTIGLVWDAKARLTGVVDSNGNQSNYQYDTDGNLTRFINAVGNGFSQQLDALGRVVLHTDATGKTTGFAYDAKGQIATMTTPSGPIAFTYDAMGNANSVTDQNGHKTSTTFDATGAIVSVTDALGKTSTLTRDGFGELIKEVAPDGQSVSWERDGKSNVIAAVDGMGNRFAYAYDAIGMMTSKTNPLGGKFKYTYGTNGKLGRTDDPSGNFVTATFTTAGLKSTITDGRGNVTNFEYDALGRVSAEVDSLGRRVSATYDAAGSLVQTTNARGQAVSFGYDAAGSMKSMSLPGDTTNYTLNPEGRRLVSTHAAGTTTVAYDDTLGRVKTRTDELGSTIGYAYDAVGNLTALTYSDGKVVTYTYDAMNRMKTVKDWANRTTTYTYDVGGSLARADLPDGSFVTYAHNAGGKLTQMIDKTSAGATIFSANFLYDAAGHTKSADLSVPLVAAPAAATRVFTYDADNQIKTVNGVTFGYDADGNLTSGTIEGAATTLVYDALNRIVQRNADVYRYDTDNFRILVTRGGVTTRYVWEGTSRNLQLLEEKNASGVIVARYVHGAIGLIGREDAATAAFSVYHYDSRGSTLALTSIAGAITDRYAYDPYGKVIGRQGTTPNPFTFSGRDGAFDDGGGVYYMTMRFYVPSLGRFAQKEAIYRGTIMRPDSLNRYAYAEGNPIDRADPRGECFVCFTALIGAVASGVAQVVENAIENKPFYEGLAGALVSGAITGAAASLGPWGAAAAGGLAAGAGDFVNQGIEIASGDRESFDLVEIGTDVAVGAVLGGGLRKLFPGSAAKGALKNLTKTIANDAYDLAGAYTVPKSANAVRFDQLFKAVKKVGTKVGKHELGKVLPINRFIATGSSDVVADVTGTVPQSCDIKPRNALGGYQSDPYLIDNKAQSVVNASKH